jgi:EAL domain-containing protein (putative c-di-GMP-specific phosphodiesterase class I)
LELTEHCLLEDSERVLEPLRELRRLGVGLGLDDFGTGFSSLSYLKQFPFTKLKIDRSFVHDVIEDSEAAAIVEAIIDLGHNLDLKIIAEGIETIQQLSFLRAKNCTEGQGYLFSQPIAAEDIIPWANRNRGTRLSLVE